LAALPTADAGGPYTIAEGDSVLLDASASFDPDGDPLIFSWDLDNDSVFGDAIGETPTVTWLQLQDCGIDDNGMELTRFLGHLILGLSQGKEAWNGSIVEVSGGVPA